jgi:hypothetical protein
MPLNTGIGGLILRGMVCGLLAGLVAGLFAFVIAEPVIDQAIAREHALAAAAAGGGTMAPEVFSRPTQHTGLVVATATIGTAFGGLFGMLFYGLARRCREGSGWSLALTLAGALFVGYFLVPFLRYPANPPGAGDPATIGQRSSATLLAALIGLVAVAAAWRLGAWVRTKHLFEPLHHLAATLLFVAVVAIGYSTLPNNTDPIQVPATLLWNFRMLSVATQLLLWGTLGVTFGLWVEWSARTAGSTAATRQIPSVGASNV